MNRERIEGEEGYSQAYTHIHLKHHLNILCHLTLPLHHAPVAAISGQMLEMYADPKRQQVEASRGAAPPSALADAGTPDHQYQLATPALGMDRASTAIPIPSGGTSMLNKRKYEEVEGLEEGAGGPKMPKIEAAYEEVIPYEEVIHYEEVGLKVEGR